MLTSLGEGFDHVGLVTLFSERYLEDKAVLMCDTRLPLLRFPLSGRLELEMFQEGVTADKTSGV